MEVVTNLNMIFLLHCLRRLSAMYCALHIMLLEIHKISLASDKFLQEIQEDPNVTSHLQNHHKCLVEIKTGLAIAPL